ncbi:hypothetical protein F5J12DRAFT_784447 [Pisolithus orientalis]|uniref:uncharacterized protein n=1 Tax=Pisolithus orientalis TaxID=936130 RepID=UPI0022240FF8|nr:uncharacterized protein F5J12DRAFT_784447 [Pisolithus orientalis]KAI6000134.1 hypothetical protein F5J12DRAFT_784447 [Pisolithus orientalis]
MMIGQLLELGRCGGDLYHASSSNGVLSERHVDMESQGGSTNGLLEEGVSANDSHTGSIKGDLGKPEDWKEGSVLVHHQTGAFTTSLKHPPPAHQSFNSTMSTANTSTFIPAQLTDNIQPVITTENAKWMVEEAARVTMQALRGLQGQDTKHWGKVAQLVWAQLPKSHPYYKVMEELTRPSSRAKHQAQPVDKGKGKELGTDEAQRIQLLETMARTTGVAMQKPGNEEDQNREKAQGCSQSRHGWPAAKPVDASDQTSRGQSWSRRPMKKVKPAVDEDVQDQQDINNPPESWEVVLETECQMSKGTKPKSICQSIQSNKPSFVPWPMDWLPHGNYYSIMAILYWEEVTILKQENADMRQEIEVTHTELAALHQVYLTCWSWWNLALQPVLLRFNHPKVAQDRSPLNPPPPASFKGGASLEVPPLNVEAVHGPAGGLAISITPPPPAVGSVPGHEGRMEVD